MPEVNNDNKTTKSQGQFNDSMDEGSIDNNLDSDNAFSDSGLENATLLDKAMRKGKSK
ncbi:hypothetical protein V7068_08435 [Bacillus sp. JJ634]